MLDLVYQLNQRGEIEVKTPYGDSLSLKTWFDKVHAVLGAILNHCSLDQICRERRGYQNGKIEFKPLEFVGFIADSNVAIVKLNNVTMSSVLYWNTESLLLQQKNAKF